MKRKQSTESQCRYGYVINICYSHWL